MLSQEYFNNPRMSQSKLKWILYGAEEFYYHMHNPSPSSDAQDLGSAVHLLLLQPHLSDMLLCLDKPAGNTRLGKAFKQLAANNVDDIFLSTYKEEIDNLHQKYGQYFEKPEQYLVLGREEYDKAHRIAESVRKNIDSRDLLARCTEFETLKLYSHKDIDFKAQLDGSGENFILDLKTTRTLNDDRLIKSQIYSYHYHFQAASYLLSEGHNIYSKDYYIIFVRTEPPYAVFPVMLSLDTLMDGMNLFERACDLYKESACNENGSFTVNNRIKTI